MIFDRWLTLGATTGLEALAGLGFAFSLYSPELKKVLNLSQPELQGLGTAMLCGGLFGILPGLVYDSLFAWPKLGPRLVAVIGLGCHLTGYTILWATICGCIQPSYLALIVNGFLLCNGPSWCDTVSNVVNVQNFPLHRGPVAGFLKGFHGLSTGIAAQIFAAFFAPDVPKFMIYLAIAPVALNLPSLVPLNRIPCSANEQPKKTGAKLLWLTTALLGLYIYQGSSALLMRSQKLSPFESRGVVVIGLSIMAGIVLACSFPQSGNSAERDLGSEHEKLLLHELSSHEAQGRDQSELIRIQEDGSDGQPLSAGEQRQLTLWEAMVTPDFWLLFSALVIGVGGGITLNNNLGQHVMALNGDAETLSIAVLVLATAHGFGCLAFGPFSEYVVQKLCVGRTALLAGLSAGTALGSLFLALTGLNLLLPCVGLAGLISGGYWPLFPSTTADLFGTRHFAAIRGILHISSPMGTALLSILLTGTLYESAHKRQSGQSEICKGPSCFRTAYLIIALLASLQTVLSWWLHLRSRPLYVQLRQTLEAAETLHPRDEIL